jgi:hypothetical protein
VAVVGAEEAMPVLARLSLLRRLTRLPQLRLAPLLPLPAKFSIRFLEQVHAGAADPGAGADDPAAAGPSASPDDPTAAADAGDDAQAQALAEEIRALIQENLLEMVASRRSAWLG